MRASKGRNSVTTFLIQCGRFGGGPFSSVVFGDVVELAVQIELIWFRTHSRVLIRVSIVLHHMVHAERMTYSFKRLHVSTCHLSPIHEENPVYQDNYTSSEQREDANMPKAHSQNELPEAASFTALVHPGREYRSLARRLYLRSRRNWYLGWSFVKSGGHSFWALYGLL